MQISPPMGNANGSWTMFPQMLNLSLSLIKKHEATSAIKENLYPTSISIFEITMTSLFLQDALYLLAYYLIIEELPFPQLKRVHTTK